MAFSCLKVPSVFKFKNLLRHNVFHQQNSLFHPKVLSYWEFDQNNACLNNILQALRIGAFNQDSRGFHYDCENFVDLRFQLQYQEYGPGVCVCPQTATAYIFTAPLCSPNLVPCGRAARISGHRQTGDSEEQKSKIYVSLYSACLQALSHIIGPVHRQYLCQLTN